MNQAAMQDTQARAGTFNLEAELARQRATLAQADRGAIALMEKNAALRDALRDALTLIPKATLEKSPAIAAWFKQSQSLL